MAESFARTPSLDLLQYYCLDQAVSVTCTSGAAAVTSALTVGELYVLVADHPVHFLIGNHTSGAVSQVQASVTDFPLGAYQPKAVWVWSSTAGGANDIGNDAVSFKSKSGSGGGTAWYARVVR